MNKTEKNSPAGTPLSSAITTSVSNSSYRDNNDISNRINSDNNNETEKDEPTIEPKKDSIPLSGRISIQTSETKSEWELTWPIWHMLPRDERKAIALKHGMKTIGEFEEYMSLHKAEALSAAMSVAGGGPAGTKFVAYANSSLYNNQIDESITQKETVIDDIAVLNEKIENNFDLEDDCKLAAIHSDDEGEEEGEEESRQEEITFTNEELIQQGGEILRVPVELLHIILSFLEVDYYSLCALVHPTWSIFTRNEQTYKILCQRLYMKQSKRKKLRIHKFQNSYWNMLMTRPRVRTGTGFYILKYKQVKKIQRDMWTEIPVGAILETVYYRYMYFFENGQVLYALTTSSPLEMVGRIKNMIVDAECNDKHLVWGRYEVSKYDIQVRAKHSWCNVILDLRLIATPHSTNALSKTGGKFCTMALVRHRTSTVVDFDENGFGDEKKDDDEMQRDNNYIWWKGSATSSNVVEHDVPSEYFRFVRDWRL